MFDVNGTIDKRETVDTNGLETKSGEIVLASALIQEAINTMVHLENFKVSENERKRLLKSGIHKLQQSKDLLEQVLEAIQEANRKQSPFPQKEL